MLSETEKSEDGGREKERTVEIQTKVQLKYSDARDCGTRMQGTRHTDGPVARTSLLATMSSGATPLSRKRTHSFEQGGERSVPDTNAKKPRIPSETPSSRLKKKRRAKKRNLPVVEDIAGSGSTRSHNGGAELMSPEAQHRGGHRGKPRRVVESDEEEDANFTPWQTPHSQMTQGVRCGGA